MDTPLKLASTGCGVGWYKENNINAPMIMFDFYSIQDELVRLGLVNVEERDKNMDEPANEEISVYVDFFKNLLNYINHPKIIVNLICRISKCK